MPASNADEIYEAVAALQSRFGGELYLITCGAKGACAVSEDRHWFEPASPPANFEDAVGAGDAFAAASITGLLREAPVQQILKQAVGFAARICGITGATTTDRDIYDIL